MCTCVRVYVCACVRVYVCLRCLAEVLVCLVKHCRGPSLRNNTAFQYTNEVAVKESEEVMDVLPRSMRQALALALHERMLSTVPIFYRSVRSCCAADWSVSSDVLREWFVTSALCGCPPALAATGEISKGVRGWGPFWELLRCQAQYLLTF